MKRIISLVLAMTLFVGFGLAQEKGDKKEKEKKGYEFKVVKEVPATSVKTSTGQVPAGVFLALLCLNQNC